MKAPRSLILTRHGQSTGNVAIAAAKDAGAEEWRVDERDPDVPLTGAGCEQAAALGERLARMPDGERPAVVVSSPYVRALDTARIALARMPGDPPVEVDERIRDRELGVLHGLTRIGIERRHPEEAARLTRLGKFYHRPPGGESWADLALRLRSFYRDLAAAHPDADVLVVAHDAIVVMTRYLVEELSEREIMEVEKEPVGNCSVSRWVRRDGRLRPDVYNDG